MLSACKVFEATVHGIQWIVHTRKPRPQGLVSQTNKSPILLCRVGYMWFIKKNALILRDAT